MSHLCRVTAAEAPKVSPFRPFAYTLSSQCKAENDHCYLKLLEHDAP